VLRNQADIAFTKQVKEYEWKIDETQRILKESEDKVDQLNKNPPQ